MCMLASTAEECEQKPSRHNWGGPRVALLMTPTSAYNVYNVYNAYNVYNVFNTPAFPHPRVFNSTTSGSDVAAADARLNPK